MKIIDYNKLFAELKEECERENILNAFSCISIEELKQLNYLLYSVIKFHDEIDEDVLKLYEHGDDIIRLHLLADILYLKDFSNKTHDNGAEKDEC